MSNSLDIAIAVSIVVGILLSGGLPVFWGRYKLLHLVPFAYGFVSYLVIHFFDPGAPFLWSVPLVSGCVYYGLCWGTVMAIREADSKMTDLESSTELRGIA